MGRLFAEGQLIRNCFIAVVCLGICASAAGQLNYSRYVYPNTNGTLIAMPDKLGNRIPDFSNVGYKGGTVPIPANVSVKATVSPIAGDNGTNIQAAIDAVAALPVDANGFRGVVLLNPGEYPIEGFIQITASGVVLRGSGTNTILRGTGTTQRTLVQVRGTGSRSTVSGTTRNLIEKYVPVGARSFTVDSTNGLSVGDTVLVLRPSTTNWIHDIGMDLLDVPWTAGSKNLNMDRVITRVEGTTITLDAPIICAIEQQYGGGTIREYAWTGRIRNVGIENLAGISDYSGNTNDEAHAWSFIEFTAVQDGWVRNIASQSFGKHCVSLIGGTKWVTVSDCQSLDPISIVTGERRYAFYVDDADLCLFRNCYTRRDRHQFISGSQTSGPHVFVDGTSDLCLNDTGPHHRWASGLLWDRVVVNGNNLNIQNRGNSGTGHGWAGANCVAWNCAANGFIVQNPPTAQNWLVGSVGAIQPGTMYIGPHDPGNYDSSGTGATNVFLRSLYYAQLQQRMREPGLEFREYWLGDRDEFSTTNATGDAVNLNAAWAAAIAGPIAAFDFVTSNQWVAFTFDCPLAVTVRVVGATLSIALRAGSSGVSDDRIYLDSLTNSFTFSGLGWLPIGTTGSSVRVFDLKNQLNLLQDGRLNIAVAEDAGVDWAVLNLQVAPVLNIATNTFPPEADAYVRNGTFAAGNFGTSNTLVIKADNSIDVQREGFLRFNLAGIAGPIVHAKLRLVPTSVGTNQAENNLAFVSDDTWGETTVTWNNKPASGQVFASWLPRQSEPVEVAVTPFVQEALEGDGNLSLKIFSTKPVGGDGIVSYASRENATAGNRPQLIVTAFNTPPTLSAVSNQLTAVNVPVGPLPITVADLETPASNLVLTAATSDPSVVPASNIVFGGNGSNRTVTITPATNYSGVATLTIIVSDGWFAVSNSFLFTVQATPIESWRQSYFGTTANAGDAADTADATGTGQNNLFKYAAGLDPTNPASVFKLRIANVTNQPAQMNLIFTPLATGRTYMAEFDTVLPSASWQPLNDFIGPFTNGNQVTITDTNAIEPEKFYRMKISLP